MKFTSKYDIEQLVYLVHDPEQQAWQITSITFTGNAALYELKQGRETTDAYEYEISSKPNILLKLNKQKDEN